MKNKPIKVKLINQEGNVYHIKFPNLEVPVKVNKHLYRKMLYSPDYQFWSTNANVRQSFSA